jgi:hypothetical protein
MLEEAVAAIGYAVRQPSGGSYWPMRVFLDRRDIFNGDLSDLAVIDAVCRAALESGPEGA